MSNYDDFTNELLNVWSKCCPSTRLIIQHISVMNWILQFLPCSFEMYTDKNFILVAVFWKNM